MTDDELLKALRDTVRVEHYDFAAAKLSPRASEDAAFIDRLTDNALRELTRDEASAPLAPRVQSVRIQSIAPRSLLRRSLWALPLAAAAAVLFLLAPEPEPEAIAVYRVEVVLGAEQATRGVSPEAGALPEAGVVPDAASLSFHPLLPFELGLRPAAQTSGPLAAKVYLSEGHWLTALPARIEISEQGMVRVHGKLPQTLDVASQSCFLLVAVGRPGAIPAVDSWQNGDEMRRERAWQAFRIEIHAPRP